MAEVVEKEIELLLKGALDGWRRVAKVATEAVSPLRAHDAQGASGSILAACRFKGLAHPPRRHIRQRLLERFVQITIHEHLGAQKDAPTDQAGFDVIADFNPRRVANILGNNYLVLVSDLCCGCHC